MDLAEAENLARMTMARYGLEDWGFAWSRSRQKAGEARNAWRRGVYHQEIVLSRPLTEVMPYAKVYDIILHEVAHGVVGIDEGHSNIWLEQFLRMGGSGTVYPVTMEWAEKVATYTYHCTLDDEICLVSQRRLSTVPLTCTEHGAGLQRKRIIDGRRVQDLDVVRHS